MKIFLLINVLCIAATSHTMHNGNYSSKPLQVPGKNSDFRPLTSSKSPGDWAYALSSLDLRSKQELEEARLHGYGEAKKDALAIEVTSFIAHESIVTIKNIIDKKFQSSIAMGNTKIDTILKEELQKIRAEKTHPNQSDVAFDPARETRITYKIRSNPEIAHKMDKQIIKMALLLNETIRFSESK